MVRMYALWHCSYYFVNFIDYAIQGQKDVDGSFSIVDSQKFRHPNYSALLRELIVICSIVRQASQIFQLKVPKYFDSW